MHNNEKYGKNKKQKQTNKNYKIFLWLEMCNNKDKKGGRTLKGKEKNKKEIKSKTKGNQLHKKSRYHSSSTSANRGYYNHPSHDNHKFSIWRKWNNNKNAGSSTDV